MRVFEAITQFRKQHQLVLHGIGLTTAVSIQIAQAFKLPIIPPPAATAITFSVLAYILKDISDNTCPLKRNKFYRHQEKLYGDLIQQIQELDRVKEATLIQYSGRKAASLIYALLSKGADVTLYLKDENGAINQFQKGRIFQTLKELPTDVTSTSGTLKVYQYDSPASIRGALINNRVLAIGGYVYEYENAESQYKQTVDDELYAVWGHDAVGMLLHKGSAEFEMFSELFSRQVNNYSKYISATQRKPRLHIEAGKVISIS
jgi:hypothetical protein